MKTSKRAYALGPPTNRYTKNEFHQEHIRENIFKIQKDLSLEKSLPRRNKLFVHLVLLALLPGNLMKRTVNLKKYQRSHGNGNKIRKH